MTHDTAGEKLAFSLWDALCTQNMLDTLGCFSRLHRYSGLPDGEAAVEYLMDKLTEYGVACTRLPYEGYCSIPLKTGLRVTAPQAVDVPAIACAYSPQVRGLRAQLYYDAMSEGPCTERDRVRQVQPFKGRIVLSREGGPAAALRAKQAGALGLIHMWPTGERQVHHSITSGSWGTPSAQEAHLLPDLPVVTINHSDGEKLIRLCRTGGAAVELDVEMDTGVRTAHMPLAEIPGRSGHYVLVAGHYDSWYEGITDNAAANAIMLEMARVFQAHREQLVHGVRFVWWAGHSDARYGGSTWYSDHHWQDLHTHCLAYIALDICGCKNTARILPRGTMMEGPDLLPDLIARLTGERHGRYVPMTKSGDQSFFGAGVPIALYGMNEPGPEGDTGFANVGGGRWWHTCEDSMDKLDVGLMVRDAKFNTYLAARLAASPRIPVHMAYFLEQMTGYLQQLSQKLHADFDLGPALRAFQLLSAKAALLEQALARCGDDGLANEIILQTAGDLVHIAFSSTDPYHHDPAWLPGKTPPFAMMQLAAGITPQNTPPERYLFHKTGFRRLCNRVAGEGLRVARQIDHQLQWLA